MLTPSEQHTSTTDHIETSSEHFKTSRSDHDHDLHRQPKFHLTAQRASPGHRLPSRHHYALHTLPQHPSHWSPAFRTLHHIPAPPTSRVPLSTKPAPSRQIHFVTYHPHQGRRALLTHQQRLPYTLRPTFTRSVPAIAELRHRCDV